LKWVRHQTCLTFCYRLFDWQNGTLHNGGNYILEVALHEYLLQVRCIRIHSTGFSGCVGLSLPQICQCSGVYECHR
jgi:hypothetical protein